MDKNIKILMCPPQYYGIEYSINPWMNIKNKANNNLALKQWEDLVKVLESFKEVKIEYLNPLPGLPDMVFTANAALIIENKAFLSNFKYPERQPEVNNYLKWFNSHGYSIIESEEVFEGAGDALFLEDTLICGYGFRSNASFYQKLNEIKKELVELKDPRFYHLDTCFCPLANGDYIIYPGAFYEKDINKIRSIGKQEIKVSEKEALKFACNAVFINNSIVLPKGCLDTEFKLRELGYYTYSVEMSEFIKAGGACKCLTLKLK